MAALFRPDGSLITPTLDSLRGREAIEHYFATAQPGATDATFRFDREPPLERCGEGAYERGWYWAEVRFANHPPDTLTGRFLIKWGRDSLGNALVAWAALSSRAPSWPPPRKGCVNLDQRYQQATRTVVTLLPAGLLIGRGPYGAVESAMIDQGWNQPTVNLNNGASDPTPRLTGRSQWNVVGGVRYRFREGLAAEITMGTVPRTSVFAAGHGELLDFSSSALFAGPLVSIERWGFQLGAGPVVQSVSWDFQERPPGSTTVANETTSRTSSVGLVADLGFHAAAAKRLRFDARCQLRRFTVRTPSAPNFTPVDVTYNSSFVGIGFGVVF